jgi:hypothetical protein
MDGILVSSGLVYTVTLSDSVVCLSECLLVCY